MDNQIADMLATEIENTILEISRLETNTEEARAALMKLGKLQEQRIKELEALMKEKQMTEADIAKQDELELKKAEIGQRISEAEAEVELKKAELAAKDAELQEAKKGRRWRTFVDILGIGTPLAVSSYFMVKGLKFEEEGKIYSSRTSQFVSGITRLFGKKG